MFGLMRTATHERIVREWEKAVESWKASADDFQCLSKDSIAQVMLHQSRAENLAQQLAALKPQRGKGGRFVARVREGGEG